MYLNKFRYLYCQELSFEHHHDSATVQSTIRRQWFNDYTRDGHFYLCRAKGCEKCGGTGYRGRVGIHELLDASPEIKKAIISHMPAQELTHLAIQEGMQTLKSDGIEKVLQGITDISQVRRVCIK